MNTNRQLLVEGEITLLVSGKGKSIEEATAAIFKQISRQVYKEVGQPVIQMDTKEVYFDSIEPVENKSLLGKKDPELIVEARVLILVKYLDIYKEEK